ncbi:MAG TPA: DUF2911 domain-containing protein [Cyclobacteriaceae bacterium]|nr:DUF2911 domain-containing protein [Cyclobacteriaceae bacterium]
MKYLLIAFILITSVAYSQIPLPEMSPTARVVEEVGYTKINIRYGRPSARKRKIMGEVVPYNRLWRTGAGPCTTISFSTPVEISNKNIAAGSYAFITTPGEKEWTVFLNSDTTKIYGDPSEYNVDTEITSFKVIPVKTDRFYESLTISIDINKYDATLYLSWENTQISFPIKTRSYERSVAEIKKYLATNPTDPEMYALAAWFYYMNNDDSQQALTWIDKGLAMGDNRWLYSLRFDVLERMKNYAEARKTADRAIAFMKRAKPVEWEDTVVSYEERVKKLPR